MSPGFVLWRFVVLVAFGATLLCATAVGVIAVVAPRRPALAPTPPVTPPEIGKADPQPPYVPLPAPEPAERPAPAPVVGTKPRDVPRPTTPDIRPRVIVDRPEVPVLRDVQPLPGPARATLPPEVQEEVNRAIDRGVKYLETQRRKTGPWQDQHPVAMTALPGLTLLECGVPATDERIVNAAKFVRENIARVHPATQTYTFSLVVLFLDRLGDPADRPLLRTLALRLIAGQEADGGWWYTVPELKPADELPFLKALTMTRPRDLGRLTRELEAERRLPAITGGGAVPEKEKDPTKGPGLAPLTPPSDEEIDRALGELPAGLRNLPGLTDEPKTTKRTVKSKRGRSVVVGGRSDNSNTQFAALALWAALRHGVPAERSLQAMAERFRKSQRLDGRWNYSTHVIGGHGSEAMTGVGLLGLAIGHGLTADAERKSALDDAAVKKGLDAMGRFLGPGGPRNLYFLWTLERVGVLYDLKEIGDKDWYRHAVDVLLKAQAADGCWQTGQYHGWSKVMDTCLALLILKRANFTPELTRQLSTGLTRSRP